MLTFATPAALLAAIKGCVAACTLVLAPGAYDRMSMNGVNPTVEVTLDISKASFTSVAVYNSSNLTLIGGSVAHAQYAAFTVLGDHDIWLVTPECDSPGTACVVVGGSQRVTVDGGMVSGSGADGVDVAGSDHVTVRGFTCIAYTPAEGAHPDCVQGWSTGTDRLTNYVVKGNVAIGDTQGFTVWRTATQLAADNIDIEGNVSSQRAFAQCIGVVGATNVVAKNNTCGTLAGAPHQVQVDFVGSAGTLGPNLLDGVSK